MLGAHDKQVCARLARQASAWRRSTRALGLLQMTARSRPDAAQCFGVALAAASLMMAAVFADAREKTAKDIAEEHHFWLWKRVDMIRPQRRDGPLRYLNVSDNEVRQIQGAASEVVGNVLVQIGGVTVGCPCEDGPRCTDQVWVQAEVHDKPFGLLLSKIDSRWAIGPVQRWWWRYEKAGWDEQDKLIDELPDCGIDEAKQEFYRKVHARDAH